MSSVQSPLSAGPRRFVGRAPELAVVSACLDAAREARPQVVVVSGEPGIGKTAFLRHCVAMAGDFTVLEASAEESEATLDLALVGQLLRRAGALADREAGGGDAIAADPRGSSIAVGAQLLAALGALQDAGPVLVALDDVHWIDPASAAALLFAVRRLSADRLCLVVGTRPGSPGAGGPGWSRLLADGERATLVPLGGLSASEVSQLAGALGKPALSARAAERLRAHTEGHPLYVKTLLGDLGPAALESQQAGLPAPRSFASAVLARLAALGDAAQDLVTAAAVAAEPRPVAALGAVAGLEDPVPALDDALGAGLLELVPGRTPVAARCAHPLVRAAVYDDLSVARRRELHLAWGRQTSGPASLAHRVAASHGHDDALAIELAREGGEAVEQARVRTGIELLLSAADVAEAAELRESALLWAVLYLNVLGDARRSHALAADVAACRPGPLRSLVRAVQAGLAGRLEEAIAELCAVSGRADEAAGSPLAAMVGCFLAAFHAYAGHGDEAVTWARRVESAGAAPAMAVFGARQAEALGLAMAGRVGEGVATLASLSGARIDSPADIELLATRGALEVWRGHLHDAVADLEVVVRFTQARGAPRSVATAFSALAEAEHQLGRWEEGLAHVELALAFAQDDEQIWELPSAHAVASALHAGRGDWAAAEQSAEAAQCAAERLHSPLSAYAACAARAHVDAARGAHDGVLEAIARLRGRLPRPVGEHLARRAWAIEAAALIETGRLPEAAQRLEEVRAWLGDAPEAPAVDLWRLRGTLAHASGDVPAAQRAFSAGREVARAAGSPYAEGRLELAHGYLLRKTARRRHAAERLGLAREHFERVGARPLRQRCDDELAACGLRRHHVADDDDGLSPRERIVAKLVIAGKSNRDVGAELYLSTKAVEYHLTNIYAKVGARSRHELPSRLPRLAP